MLVPYLKLSIHFILACELSRIQFHKTLSNILGSCTGITEKTKHTKNQQFLIKLRGKKKKEKILSEWHTPNAIVVGAPYGDSMPDSTKLLVSN